MIALKRWIGLALFVMIAPLFVHVSAQGGNLLQDPGFEGTYVNRGRPTLNTPAPWPIWIADGPHNFDWQNRADKVTAFPHTNGPEVHSGSASLNLDGGFVTYTAAVYQQVAVTPGSNLTGSAWVRIKTCNIGPNSDNCGSAVESGAFVKVGIDPNGGTDPNSPSIVWSGNFAPHDNYLQGTVTATAAAGTVTFFIYTTQASPAQLNKAWIDDASLTVGGAGGIAPGQATGVPTARPVATAFVAFVQPPRPDGSIVHIVQTGDTMTGISTAYAVPIDEIVQLNGLRSARYIFVGQELLIRAAGGSSSAAATPAGDLFSPEDLASLNTTPGPTPVGMQADAAPANAG
ncbi:MAG: LysM peptidoglycan-binding domain-containing protein [Chloroflexota bacterium]